VILAGMSCNILFNIHSTVITAMVAAVFSKRKKISPEINAVISEMLLPSSPGMASASPGAASSPSCAGSHEPMGTIVKPRHITEAAALDIQSAGLHVLPAENSSPNRATSYALPAYYANIPSEHNQDFADNTKGRFSSQDFEEEIQTRGFVSLIAEPIPAPSNEVDFRKEDLLRIYAPLTVH